MTIISLASFLIWFMILITHLKSCVSLGVGVWLFAHLVIPPFYLIFEVLFCALCTKLSLPHALTLKVIHCICGQLLDLARTHLCCSHGGEQIASHNVVQDAFASIVKDARSHVSHEQTHVFPPPSFQSIYWSVDILLLVDSICTLVDMIITNPTWVDLVSRATLSHGVAATMAT
jgi:hypothetical protein